MVNEHLYLMNFGGGFGFSAEVKVDSNLGGASALTGVASGVLSGAQQVATKTTAVKDAAISEVKKYLDEIEKFKNENGRLKTQITGFTKQMSSLNETIKGLKAKNAELLQMSASGQVSSSSQSTSGVSGKTTVITSSTTTVSGSKSVSGMASEGSSAELEKMQKQLQDCIADIAKDEAEIANLKQQNERYVLEINTLKTTLNQNTEEYEGRITTLNAQFDAIKADLSKSKSDDASDHKKIANYSQENTLLKQQLEQVNRQNGTLLSENIALKQKYAEKEFIITRIETEIRSYKIQITTITTQLEQKNTEIQTLATHKQDDVAEVERMRNTLTQKAKLISELEANISQLNLKIEALNKELFAKDEKWREADNRRNIAEKRCLEFENLNQDRERDYNVLKTKLESFESLKISYTTKISTLETTIKQRDAQLAGNAEKDKDEEKQMAELKKMLDSQSKYIENDKDHDAKVAAQLNQAMLNYQAKSKEVVEVMKKAQTDNEKLKTQIKGLKEKIKALRKEIDEAQALSMKFEIKKTEKTEAVTKIKEKEEVVAKLAKSKVEMDELKRSSLSFEATSKQVRAQNESLAKELAEAKAELVKLKNEVTITKTDLSAIQEEKKKLVEEKSELLIAKKSSSEKESSLMKSSEETVSTYKTDISLKYKLINDLFTKIESEAAYLH